jgi:hypothetical protein
MQRPFDGWRKSAHDAGIDERIEAHCAKHGLTPKDAVMHWMVLARRHWMKRFLAHAEFFKMTLEIPGDIVELGVFRGMGLMTWANLLESYCIGDRTKIVYGFDNWEGFTGFSPEDGLEVASCHKVVGGFSPKAHYQELLDAIAIFDDDRFVPQKPRIQLVAGAIEETAPAFVRDNPGVRLSLIHFDCDLYAPTKAALDAFWPRLSHGGIMLFDEYAIHEWPGETAAVDAFIAAHPGLSIKTLPWTNTPAGYIIKP